MLNVTRVEYLESEKRVIIHRKDSSMIAVREWWQDAHIWPHALVNEWEGYLPSLLYSSMRKTDYSVAYVVGKNKSHHVRSIATPRRDQPTVILDASFAQDEEEQRRRMFRAFRSDIFISLRTLYSTGI